MDQTRDSFFFQSIPHIGYWGLTKSDVFKAPTTSKNIDWFVPASFPFCSWNLKTWRYFKKLSLPFIYFWKSIGFNFQMEKFYFVTAKDAAKDLIVSKGLVIRPIFIAHFVIGNAWFNWDFGRLSLRSRQYQALSTNSETSFKE